MSNTAKFFCNHDGEFIQHGEYVESPWECVGCGLRFQPRDLAILLSLRRIERKLGKIAERVDAIEERSSIL